MILSIQYGFTKFKVHETLESKLETAFPSPDRFVHGLNKRKNTVTSLESLEKQLRPFVERSKSRQSILDCVTSQRNYT